MSPKTKRPRFWETQSTPKADANRVSSPIKVVDPQWEQKAKASMKRLEKRAMNG